MIDERAVAGVTLGSEGTGSQKLRVVPNEQEYVEFDDLVTIQAEVAKIGAVVDQRIGRGVP